MKKILFFMISVYLILAGAFRVAVAQTSAAAPEQAMNPLSSPEEEQIRMRARKRLYPGGKDEETLKVQAQLPVVSRKMAPATEAPEAAEPATADEHD